MTNYKLEVVDQEGNLEFCYDGTEEQLREIAEKMTFDEAKSFFMDFKPLWNGETIDIWVTCNNWEDVPPVAQFVQDFDGLHHLIFDEKGKIKEMSVIND